MKPNSILPHTYRPEANGNASRNAPTRSLGEKLLQRSNHFAEMDFHGMSDFIKSASLCLRIFWGIVIVGVTAFACFISYKLIKNSALSSTVSKIEFTTPKSVPYPTITICDGNGSLFLNDSKLRNDGWSDSAIKLMILSGPIWAVPNVSMPQLALLNEVDTTRFYEKQLSKYNKDPSETLKNFFKLYGATIDDIFKSCRDAGYAKLDCGKLFKPVIHASKGLCFASASSEFPTIKASGLFSNLYVKFKKPKDLWSMVKNGSDPNYEVAIDTGIDQGIWRADAVKVTLGSWVKVKLTVSYVEMESTKATPCVEEPELKYFQDFTFSNCMWEKRLYRNPNFPVSHRVCKLPILNLLRNGFDANSSISTSDVTHSNHHGSKKMKREAGENDVADPERPCSLRTIYHEIYEPIRINNDSAGFLTGIAHWIDHLNMSDYNPCQMPCERWEYGYAIESNEQFPDKKYAGLNLMLLAPQYKHVREVLALEWFDYIALIGGAWGLCVGASVVTIVQATVYTAKLILHKRFPGGDK